LRRYARDNGKPLDGRSALRLHRILDRLISADKSRSKDDRKQLHDAMDEIIAQSDADPGFEAERDRSRRETESREDEGEGEIEQDEDDPDAEVVEANDSELNDALRRFDKEVKRGFGAIPVASNPTVSRTRSYATDADAAVVSRYLQPEQSCRDALSTLSGKLFPITNDHVARGYWSGLSSFLASFPQQTKIKNVPKQTLAPLIRHLENFKLRRGIFASIPA
jgi:hypothetical protein